jgi:hypothetical protein
VQFYESCGYVPADGFTIGEWRGQILVRELGAH